MPPNGIRPATVPVPAPETIQEFKVQTGVYPAEFGHQSTQVNVVTKSGGKAYHGSIFEFVRDEKFDAKPPKLANLCWRGARSIP